LASIAFLIAVALLAAGILVYDRSRDSSASALVTTAAIVLLIGGLCGIYCSSYYFLKYHFAGELEHAAPVNATMMKPGMPGSGMMGGRDRMGGMMQMMMENPEMMQMMHRMMHERGISDDGMPMQDGEMPMRDRERMHQPEEDDDNN
ncbi:MAG: hypothetical protein R3270_04240, partial [Gammaproteobacteria bacterium]|nr:hypothetical protein [Gammaproteobacteria bacterium]